MGSHIPEENLEQYAAGHKLPDTQLAELEAHLLVCSECQDRLRELDAYVAAMRGALRHLTDGRN